MQDELTPSEAEHTDTERSAEEMPAAGDAKEPESAEVEEPESAEVEGVEAVYWAVEAVGVTEASAEAGDAAGTDTAFGLQGEAPTEKQPDEGSSMAGADTSPLGAPHDIDMGPERRSRWWVWALAVLVVASVAGGATYGWWWMTERDIVVPDLVGRQAAEATQALNDVALKLGDVSQVPTDVAPVGVVIGQKPEAGSRLKPDDTVSFVVAAAPEQTKVPNVVGLGTDDAAVMLAKARLRPFEVRSYSTTAATGYVIAQVPASGTELMPGSPVALVVSRGPAPGDSTVPSVVGLPEADALTLIGARGLTPRVYLSVDPSIGAGIVVTQTPLPNTAAAPGSSVQVLVSKGFGSGTVAVPDVVSDPRKDAVAAIRAAGLRAVVVFQFHPSAARGTVISQMPLAGRRVQSGDSVGLLVSRGPMTTALVPSVLGTSSAEATAAVSEAGFKPVVVEVEMPGRSAGTVVGQFPAPSTSYQLRYPVVCLVAKVVGR